jgi:hypothetical protein
MSFNLPASVNRLRQVSHTQPQVLPKGPLLHTAPAAKWRAHPRLHDREPLARAHNIYIGTLSHVLVSVEELLSERRGYSRSPWSRTGGDPEGEPEEESQLDCEERDATWKIVHIEAIAQSGSVPYSTVGGGIRSTTMTTAKTGMAQVSVAR